MEILFAISLVGFFLFGPWILVLVSASRRKRQRAEDQERWGELTRRVHQLEDALKTERQAAPQKAETTSPRQAPEPAPPRPVIRPAPEIAPPPPLEASPSSQAAEKWVKGVPFPVPVESEPAAPLQSSSLPEPSFAEAGPSFSDRFKTALDLEETLGTNWLNKIGIAILVLGIAFFLAYKVRTLGPAGKVLVGYVVSVALLGIGIWLERRDRYRILARAGIGGGWALLFFTTYAMYHVPAAHVLESQGLDLMLMLVVAAAMVWHTLRYRSQVVTGLAFLLAFLTVSISQVSVYSLTAGAVLALGMVAIVGPMQWFELEILGILASYLNHYLWLRPIIEPMQGHRHAFPEFFASAGILVLYWIIFRGSYVWRQPKDSRQERTSTAAALLNTALLLSLLKYQSIHPEWAFWALLVIGGVEVLLGQLPITRRRRTAVIVLSTLGVVLLVAAFPFRYSGARLSLLWLAEAEAVLLIGVWTREVVFRRLGLLATVVLTGQMIGVDAARVYGMRMDGGYVHSDFRVALLFLVATLVLYADAHWLYRRWGEMFATEFDKRLVQRLSYAAAVLALIGAWIAFPESWTAVAWCALGLALFIVGGRFKLPELGHQASTIAALGFLRILAINFEAENKYHGLTLRLITISLAAVLLYVSSRWKIEDRGRGLTMGRGFYSFGQLMSGTHVWAGSFLLSLLAWYELQPASVAVAWAMGGLVLLELGLTRKSLSLRLQAYVAFLSGFLRIFFVNLNAAGLPGEVSPRIYTVLPLILAFFYGYWRLSESVEQLSGTERKLRAPGLCCYLGTVSVVALMRFEVEPDWVAAAWASFALILFALAWRSERRIFLQQGILLVFAVLFRTVLHNFYERSYFPAPLWQSPRFTVGLVIALLFACLPVAFRLRKKEASLESGIVRLLQGIGRRPEQVLFMVAVLLLTVLLAREMRHGMVTLSWGLEGVAVFLFALQVSERSFRLTGLGLLLLCVSKILIVDVWRFQDPQARYLTLIVVGAALLLVSFMYTRHREAIRQYL